MLESNDLTENDFDEELVSTLEETLANLLSDVKFKGLKSTLKLLHQPILSEGFTNRELELVLEDLLGEIKEKTVKS